MRFKEATIYGFGKWVDYTIIFSNHSFVCVFGGNESGKSTLQQFIEFVLFGLPPKQRNFYRPKTSSQMGGRLTIIDDEVGEYIVERMDGVGKGEAVCYTADGLERDEIWLTSRLQGMSKLLYQSIYSFDAADLSEIQSMKQDEIGDVLLGVGLTGSTQIHTVEKQLNAQMGELFKPFGTKPKINQQLNQLDALVKEKKQYQQEDSTYHDKKEQIALLTKEKETLQADLKVKKETIMALEKKCQALPQVHSLIDYKQQLTALPSDLAFPENGVERLNKLKELMLPLKSEQVLVNTEQARYQKEKGQLERDLALSLNKEQAQKFIKQKQVFLNQQHELQQQHDTHKQLDLEIDYQLKHLNLELTYDQLEHLHFPYHIEKKWNELKNEQDKLQMEIDQLIEEEQALKARQNFLQNTLNEVKHQRLSKQKRSDLDKIIISSQETEQFQQKKTAWNEREPMLHRRQQTILFGSFALSSIMLLVYLFTNLSTWLILTGLSLVLGIVYWSFGKKTIKHMNDMFNEERTSLNTLTYTKDEIEEARDLIEQDHQLKNEETTLIGQLRDLDIQYLQSKEKQESWTYKNNRLKEQIDEQYHDYPFLSQVEMRYWQELFHALKNIRKLYSEKKQLRFDIEKLAKEQNQFANELHDFMGHKDDSGETSEQLLQLIEQKLTDLQAIEARQEQLKELLQEKSIQAEQLTQKVRTYQREIDELFNLANVKDEEAFLKKANALERVEQLNSAIHQLRQQVSGLFSKEELNNLHLAPEESQLELAIQENESDLSRIEKQIEQVTQELANLHADINRMEAENTYSETLYQIDMENSALNDMVRTWSVLKIAKETLMKTKERYRDKYFNRVIKQATAYFNELTEGRYLRIYIPKDNQSFLVEASNRIRYTVDELSQGTINQLYVSLRLAISQVMNEDERFPFIIDDALVHFDAKRVEKMIHILQRQSKDQQIILFTCHQATMDCFASEHVINLKKVESRHVDARV